MFWSGPLPPIAKVCIERVRSLHPTWDIQVLDDVEEPIEGLEQLSVQHRSDWVRICQMQRGGIWLDATCICVQPVDRWVDLDLDAVQGFTPPFADDTLENWAFAAPADNPLMMRWKDVFARAIREGFETFKQTAPSYIQEHEIYGHMPYLTMHACYIIAAHETGETAVMSPSCHGPFRYLCDTNWDSWRAVHRLMTRNGMPDPPPLVKLRGAETGIVKFFLCQRKSLLHQIGMPAPSSRRILIVAALLALTLIIVRKHLDRATHFSRP